MRYIKIIRIFIIIAREGIEKVNVTLLLIKTLLMFIFIDNNFVNYPDKFDLNRITRP